MNCCIKCCCVLLLLLCYLFFWFYWCNVLIHVLIVILIVVEGDFSVVCNSGKCWKLLSMWATAQCPHGLLKGSILNWSFLVPSLWNDGEHGYYFENRIYPPETSYSCQQYPWQFCHPPPSMQEHLMLLRKLCIGFPERFAELHALSHADIEVDFFANVAHLQMHRRTRALHRLVKAIPS